MFSRRTWMIPTAFMLLFLMVAGATGAAFLMWGVGLSLVAIPVALWLDFGRDKYSLAALQDAEDREELANLDPSVGIVEYDDYLCPYCRTIFSEEYRTCPKCGRVRAR